MSEGTMRGNVIRRLKPVDAVAVENPVYPGTPDVNYIDGWLELKWLRRWPKKEETIVRLEHYTPQQRLWLRRRTLRGGRAFLLLQVGKEWLLFKHPELQDVGKVTKKVLKETAHFYWPTGLNNEELIYALTRT